MKRNLSTIFLILVFFIGLSLLLYLSVSDYWNSLHQSRAIATYASAVAEIDETDYDRLWQAARAYNDNMRSRPNAHVMSEAEQADYLEQLDVSGNGIMGYIEIPEIRCTLPIYHGVDEAVLQIAVGHIDWTSLPVGGEGTNCVLSGHRGLPSAKLFTNLDQLEKGDLFMLRVLDETLSYEVDQILIVEPREVSALEVTPGEDYCTLVTCTPYGINTHRLLVRGRRVENRKEAAAVRVTADALQIEPVLVAPAVAAPMLLILLVWVLVRYRKNR